jgi:hypothetical protein
MIDGQGDIPARPDTWQGVSDALGSWPGCLGRSTGRDDEASRWHGPQSPTSSAAIHRSSQEFKLALVDLSA